jgi:predicted Zn-dependent protease
MTFKQFFLYTPLSVLLDIRYWFFRMFVRTEMEQSSLKVEADQIPLTRCIAFLQSELPRHPYWCSGHKALAELYLKSNAIDLAYTAAHSYKALLPEKKIWKAEYLLGCCYLKKRQVEQAVALFERLVREQPNNTVLEEEYAAALVAKGAYVDAIQILERIPESKRSTAIHDILSSCRSQVSTRS